jgi:membrane protease YdiL (CAAX protease family)
MVPPSRVQQQGVNLGEVKGGEVRTPLWAAAVRLGLFALLFLLALRLGRTIIELFATTDVSGIRGRAALAITGSLLGQLIATGLLLLWLRATGRGFAWLGLTRRAPLKVWAAAIAVAAAWIILVWNGVLSGRGGFEEISLWRISLALGAGLVGGTCEEIVFRGAAIQALAEARAPRWLQIIAGTALFGLAHLGWAALAGNLAMGIGAAVFTSILGLALSLIFLWGGRSLWPCIAAHALINLLIEPWLVLAAMQGSA